MGLIRKILKWTAIGFGAFLALGFVLSLTGGGTDPVASSSPSAEAPVEAAPETETLPPIEELQVGFLPQSANGNGYVIGFPGELEDGDTLYRIRVGTTSQTIPYSSCSTTAVALARLVPPGAFYELVEGKTPVDLVGATPGDLSMSFSGPVGEAEYQAWFFDAHFDLTQEFQQKPLIIKVECA